MIGREILWLAHHPRSFHGQAVLLGEMMGMDYMRLRTIHLNWMIILRDDLKKHCHLQQVLVGPHAAVHYTSSIVAASAPAVDSFLC